MSKKLKVHINSSNVGIKRCAGHTGDNGYTDSHWGECPLCLRESHQELYRSLALFSLEDRRPPECSVSNSRLTLSNTSKPTSSETGDTIRLTAAFTHYSPLRRLAAAIKVNPSARLSLKQAARIAGLEVTYFSRYFHQKTGLKYKHWSDLRLVEVAACKLVDCDDTITQIAAMFNLDITTFERAFRRVMGMAPNAYRRSFEKATPET